MTDFDVIVAGSGATGSFIAENIHAAGLRVLVVDPGYHPRLTIGEAMVPQSAMLAYINYKTFGSEALGTLCHGDDIRSKITKTCGTKHSLGFAYHESGNMHINQFIPPKSDFYDESHLYRSEVDTYLKNKLECKVIEGAKIGRFSQDSDNVRLEINDQFVSAFYLVDCLGRHSTIRSQTTIDNNNEAIKTNTSCVFGHFKDVAPFDSLISNSERPSLSKSLHDGTLHHVSKTGWIWVIPFNNHNQAGASQQPYTNGENLCSIGYVHNNKVNPLTAISSDPKHEDTSAKQDLKALTDIINRHPKLRSHLYKAVQSPRTGTVKSSKRVQFRAKCTHAKRYILAANSYGFVDPLYSNGLVNTLESAYLISSLLIRAKQAAAHLEISEQDLKKLDQLHDQQFNDQDLLCCNAYRAMQSFETWQLWCQVFLAQTLIGDSSLLLACIAYNATAERDKVQSDNFYELFEHGRPSRMHRLYSSINELLAEADQILRDYERSEFKQSELAASRLSTALRSLPNMPQGILEWGARDAHHADFRDQANAQRLADWIAAVA